MSAAVVLIEGGLVGLGAQQFYVVPAGKTIVLQACTACNSISGTPGLAIWLVGAGGVPSTATQVRSQGNLMATFGTEVLTSCNGHVLRPGDSIWARADNSGAVSLRFSGEELTA